MFIDLHPVINWLKSSDPIEASSIVLFALIAGTGIVGLFHSMILNPKK